MMLHYIIKHSPHHKNTSTEGKPFKVRRPKFIQIDYIFDIV